MIRRRRSVDPWHTAAVDPATGDLVDLDPDELVDTLVDLTRPADERVGQ